MTREEVKQVLMIITVNYPTFYKNSTPDQLKAAINLWFMMFEGDSVEEVTLAVKSHIATNVFPPCVANIRAAIVDVKYKRISSSEAWGQVTEAIRRCGHSGADKVDQYVSPEVLPILTRMGFKELCMSQNQMADRAHFIKMWDAEQKNERYNKMLPVSLAEEIEQNRLTAISELLSIDKPNSFTDYEQRDYDYEKLEKKAMDLRMKEGK